MKPVEFPEQTGVLTKPPSMTDEECSSLPIHRTDSEMISCWEPTPEERRAIARGGNIYLGVLSHGHPPVWIKGTSPFESEPESPDAEIADDQQAYINGLGEKLERELLDPLEALAIVCGRAMTVLMANVDELHQMHDAEENPVVKTNCRLLAETASGIVAGFQKKIEAVMKGPSRIVVPGTRMPR